MNIFQAEINKGNKNYQVYNDYIAIMPNAKNNIEKFVKEQVENFIEPTDCPPQTETNTEKFNCKKNLINTLVEKIAHLSVTPPNDYNRQIMNEFKCYTQSREAAAKWKCLINDLINGKLKTGDDASDYFNFIIEDFISLLRTNNFPSLLEMKNDKLIISPLYEQNNLSIMPYIISSMYTGLARSYLTEITLYSGFRGK